VALRRLRLVVSRTCCLGDFGEMARFFQESGSIVQGALLRIVVAISFLESTLLDRNEALSVRARCTGSIGSVQALALPVAKVRLLGPLHVQVGICWSLASGSRFVRRCQINA
jgi:hypothetical protein